MGVLPQQRPFLQPNLLAQTAFGLGNQQRGIETARADAIAATRAAGLDRLAKTQQTALANTPDINAQLGGDFLTSVASGIPLSEGALSKTGPFAALSAQRGQAGLLASNIKDLGSGAEALVEAGVQLPGQEIINAINNQEPQNFRSVATGNQTRLASSKALGLKFNDNLVEVYDTRTGERIPGTDLSQEESTALSNAFGRGVERQHLGTRLVRAASDAPVVIQPTEIDVSGSPTATPKDDPNIVVDPNEPDPTNTAEEPPPIQAGSARDREVDRVAASQNLAGDTSRQVTVDEDTGLRSRTVTSGEGTTTITEHPDGTGTAIVPDGRPIPLSKIQLEALLGKK